MGPLSPGHESRSASAEISGVSGRIRRMGRTTNPLIDAIAAARWVPRLRRDTVIASSCISVPRPVVHRSRGTRPGRRRPRAIQLSASPYPGLVSTRPRSGKIPGRMSPQPTGLGDSTESERESEDLGVVVIVDVKLPAIFPAKMEFLRVWRKGRIEGAPTLPFLPPTLEPPSFRVLNHRSTALSTLTFSYDKINRLLLKESVRFRIAIQFLVEKSFHRRLSPHPTAHPPVLTKSGIQSPISPSILIPAQHGAEMSMNAKPWKPRSFSLRVSLTVLPLRWS